MKILQALTKDFICLLVIVHNVKPNYKRPCEKLIKPLFCADTKGTVSSQSVQLRLSELCPQCLQSCKKKNPTINLRMNCCHRLRTRNSDSWWLQGRIVGVVHDCLQLIRKKAYTGLIPKSSAEIRILGNEVMTPTFMQCFHRVTVLVILSECCFPMYRI